MSAVFSHGRLRLYLLKLLDDGPKHGYELIRLLENRFHGLYAPSAGTIYPRLQRMEADGLVTHTAAGGRKVYDITDAGRAELRQRADELTDAGNRHHTPPWPTCRAGRRGRAEVRGSVRDLKRELRRPPAGPQRTRWGWRLPAAAPGPRARPGPRRRPGGTPCWPSSRSGWPQLTAEVRPAGPGRAALSQDDDACAPCRSGRRSTRSAPRATGLRRLLR